MARRLRLFLPDLSVHVIQRGNNRASIFTRGADCVAFLTFLRHAAADHGVSLHAFALMTTHFHLIVTPDHAGALPRMMQVLGVRYVRYFNDAHARIGTLWNGRYRGLIIQDERYWLTCLRYVEQNPVRAGMVRSPADYRWSSYPAHAFGRWPAWLTPHAVYRALGSTPGQRQQAYRSMCATQVSDEDLPLLRSPTCRAVLIGP